MIGDQAAARDASLARHVTTQPGKGRRGVRPGKGDNTAPATLPRPPTNGAITIAPLAQFLSLPHNPPTPKPVIFPPTGPPMPGKPAARQGDAVSHGLIVQGSNTVLIGTQGGVACSVCPGGIAVGSPVNPALGAKVLTDETDFALPAPAIPLIWTRAY
ncbi:MAG: DUF6531 domain-containing protein, partial [Zoogloeaceae bacterium]|nr:DUF6531 domain-containing protein [Zoogloeaceae bacterium]